ncbi:MAG: hypothetical protein RLZZ225_975 [Pseudomonadota bacterium]
MIPTNIEHIANALGKIFPVNLFLVNENGKIRWASERLLKLSGISELKAIRGKHVGIFGEKEWLHTKRVVESKKEEILYEKIQGKNFITIKVPYVQGGFRGVMGLSIDITAIKQAEMAKQEFLMNMAHDLRTPLAGIIGLSSIQADGKMKQQEQQQYGAWIHGASKQLLELLNSVIEITATEHQIEPIKKEIIDLIQLAKELKTLMQPSLQSKGLQFQAKIDSALPTIISDRIKLKRLLLNLLGNAVKFTEQGGISLEIKQISLENDQTNLEMCVTDTGIGIAKDKLDKIFDRFYRVYPSYQAEYKGYGIGLYLVKKTVESLSGEIKVSSEEGVGSRFILRFTFPVAGAVIDKESAITTLQLPISTSYLEPGKLEGTVLAAEDNDLQGSLS